MIGFMLSTLLQAPRASLLALLEAYATDFEWYCFCLACGHSPGRSQETLQALYQAQARWRGRRMGELYPLVCAHWDAVNLAQQLAATGPEPQRRDVQQALREAKARHRAAVQQLQAAWQDA